MNYNLLFAWLAFAALLAKGTKTAMLTTENGYEQLQTSKGFAIVTSIPIIIFVCTSTRRYWTDYGGYLWLYEMFPVNLTSAFSYIMSQEDSKGFYAFTFLIKILSGGNVFAYRFGLAILQAGPFIYLYRKYSPNNVFSVFLFTATAIPIAWMLNGIRQLCAAAIIYAATPLIIEKKYLKVLLVILFASLFHQTAVLMIPVAFIAQGKAWNWRTNLAIVGMVVLAMLFARVSGAADSLYVAAGYSNSSVLVGDDGVHPLRVLVSFVPAFLAFLSRRTIKEYNSSALNVFVNMSIISFGIYLIAMVTSGILVGRVPLYMDLYNLILLPIMINLLFKGKVRKIIYALAVVLYFAYYYVQYGAL